MPDARASFFIALLAADLGFGIDCLGFSTPAAVLTYVRRTFPRQNPVAAARLIGPLMHVYRMLGILVEIFLASNNFFTYFR